MDFEKTVGSKVEISGFPSSNFNCVFMIHDGWLTALDDRFWNGRLRNGCHLQEGSTQIAQGSLCVFIYGWLCWVLWQLLAGTLWVWGWVGGVAVVVVVVGGGNGSEGGGWVSCLTGSRPCGTSRCIVVVKLTCRGRCCLVVQLLSSCRHDVVRVC